MTTGATGTPPLNDNNHDDDDDGDDDYDSDSSFTGRL